MGVLKRIIGDENRLMNQGGTAFISSPGRKMPEDFSPGTCRVVGFVPSRMRATLTLISLYQKKFKKAATEADRTELAGLIGAARYRWRTRWAECCETIKKPDGGVIILKNWSIASLTVEFAGRKA